jgi:uncharacterized protein (DUF2336 family)
VSSDFREIANRNDSGKSDRLFRAAVSAFSSLTRPTRREIAQLSQLTLPLFDRASPEAKRYVAAVLSESRYAPVELIQRLCSEPVEICAPLLMRSPVIGNADLVRIIGRHGASHARVVARRPGLHPAIAALTQALDHAASEEAGALEATLSPAAEASAMAIQTTPPLSDFPSETPRKAVAVGDGRMEDVSGETSEPARGSRAAEAVRRDLRAIMAGARPAEGFGSTARSAGRDAHEDDYQRLKTTLLSGNTTYFRTALADALGIGVETARAIAASRSYDDLIAAFRHIGLSEEEAFLLVCAACPERFTRAGAIRMFLERYRAVSGEAAEGIVLAWRTERLRGPTSVPRTVKGGAGTVHALAARRGASES